MKAWLYGIGLGMLPVGYLGLMVATHQPIEWPVLLLMLLIVVPIFVFRKGINSIEQDVRYIVGDRKTPPPRPGSSGGRRPTGSPPPRS